MIKVRKKDTNYICFVDLTITFLFWKSIIQYTDDHRGEELVEIKKIKTFLI